MIDDMIKLPSGREVRLFLQPWEKVEDRTIRCIACGQIDDVEQHDEELCAKMHKARHIAKQIAEREIGGPPKTCTGHIARRYDAAYKAALRALMLPAKHAAIGAFLDMGLRSAPALARDVVQTFEPGRSGLIDNLDRLDCFLARYIPKT